MKKKKKYYQTPELEVVMMQQTNIVCASPIYGIQNESYEEIIVGDGDNVWYD